MVTHLARNRIEERSDHLEHDGRSLTGLVRELRDEAIVLVRQEVALARTEMSEKAARVALPGSPTAVLGYTRNLDTIAAHFFGVATPDDPSLAAALAVVALVVGAGCWLARGRVRAVEVIG